MFIVPKGHFGLQTVVNTANTHHQINKKHLIVALQRKESTDEGNRHAYCKAALITRNKSYFGPLLCWLENNLAS